MTETQIPLYRAKRKDTGEWVEGYFAISFNDIDPLTLAIHFPDMLDKSGKKIWAALNKSGVGGSNVKYQITPRKTAISVARYVDRHFYYSQETVEVTGIFE